MSEVLIKQSSLKGTVVIPPSKSVAHRAIICAALSEGESVISPVSESQDMIATIEAVKLLGANVLRKDSALMISGCNRSVDLHADINCIESGSTLRFMIPIAAALGGSFRFTGRGRLPSRPIDCYERLLREHGVEVDYDGALPFSIKGKLTPGRFELPGNVSSQYITGLLMALPMLEADSEIVLTTKLESCSYVNITVSVMKSFGVQVSKTDSGYFIKGGQSYKPQNYTVESDWSQGAFFLCAGALGADITVKGLNTGSLQGDRKAVNILREMGAQIDESDEGFTFRKAKLHSCEFDAGEIPDIVPILSVAAMFCKGTTHIKNCSRLRIKESDRLVSTNDMLLSFGAVSEIKDDELYITGTDTFTEYRRVNGFNDHRIVMSSAVAAAFAPGETLITDSESVSKSYPNFFEHYKNLGGAVSDF